MPSSRPTQAVAVTPALLLLLLLCIGMAAAGLAPREIPADRFEIHHEPQEEPNYCMHQGVFAHYYGQQPARRWHHARVLSHTRSARPHYLIVDIDLTVCDSSARFKRHATATGMGPGLKKFSEYTADPPIPGAADAIAQLHHKGCVR